MKNLFSTVISTFILLFPSFLSGQLSTLKVSALGPIGQSGVLLKVESPNYPTSFKSGFDLSLSNDYTSYCDNTYCFTHDVLWDLGSFPKMTERIKHSNPIWSNKVFENTYGISTGDIKTTYNNLQSSRIFNPVAETCETKVATTNPLYSDRSMSSVTDLTLAKESNFFCGLNYCYNKDVNYGLDELAPSVTETIGNSLPALDNLSFENKWELSTGEIKRSYSSLHASETFDPATPKLTNHISSTDPAFSNRYIETSVDISQPGALSYAIKAAVTGTPPIEMEYEYDAVNWKIKEACTAEENGNTLSITRNMATANGALEIGGALDVAGSVSSSSGPLVLQDNLVVNGSFHTLNGIVTVNGNFQVEGVKMFKIDHPLDPDNKYLIHSCVESPDIMNVYNGNTTTDEQGFATIRLPEYFEALNSDFRYQLTCIGQFAQVIIAEKIKENSFSIRTDKKYVEVSWQVTGIRKDPAADRSHFRVEVEKEPEMKGKRLYHPQQ